MNTTVTIATQPCAVCGARSILTLDAEKVARWENGELIQRVWPEMPAEEREVLISGVHPNCWDQLFAE